VAPNSGADHRVELVNASETAAITPELLIGEVEDLVSPPEVCSKLFQLLDAPDTTAEEIGQVLGSDPALAAKLLKLVNSAHFNFSTRIDTISRAVAIAGQRELYAMAVAVSALQCFGRIPPHLVNMDVFWRHSLYVALLARRLARLCSVLHPERLFVAGLLHDLGYLLLCRRLPELMKAILIVADGDEGLLAEAESRHLGFSHGHLAAELFKLWNLPEGLQQAAAQHHQSPDEGFSLECLIIQAADDLAAESLLGNLANREVAADQRAASSLALLADHAGVALDSQELLAAANLEFVEISVWLLQG